jgi:hypothetical protein
VVLFDLGDSSHAEEAQTLVLLRQIRSIAPATKPISMTGENLR